MRKLALYRFCEGSLGSKAKEEKELVMMVSLAVGDERVLKSRIRCNARDD